MIYRSATSSSRSFSTLNSAKWLRHYRDFIGCEQLEETLSVFRWLADFSFTARKHWSNGKKLSFVHDLYLSHSSFPAYNLGSELASPYKSTHVFPLYFSTYESRINGPIIASLIPFLQARLWNTWSNRRSIHFIKFRWNHAYQFCIKQFIRVEIEKIAVCITSRDESGGITGWSRN